MPAKKRKKTINLLPSEEFKASALGRILKWMLTTFRVMVIVTEMIVMGAFLSRFWLDARNSDLNEQINISKAQVEAYKPIEEEFRGLQKRLLIADELYSSKKRTELIDMLSSKIPADIYLNSINQIDNQIQIKASSLSEQSILNYVTNLESSNNFKKVSLNQISSDIENGNLIIFTVSAEI